MDVGPLLRHPLMRNDKTCKLERFVLDSPAVGLTLTVECPAGQQFSADRKECRTANIVSRRAFMIFLAEVHDPKTKMFSLTFWPLVKLSDYV